MAARKRKDAPRKRSRVRRNPPAAPRKRARVRRNPPMMALLRSGAFDAVAVIGGELGANVVASFIPPMLKDAAGAETETGKLVRQAVGAVAVGVIASRIGGGKDFTRAAVAGAFSAPGRAIAKKALPASGRFSRALGAYPRATIGAGMAGGTLGAYPRALLPASAGLGSSVVSPFAYGMA